MELQWTTSVSASCFYAVDSLYRGRRLLDKALEHALGEPTRAFVLELEELGLVPSAFFAHLVPLAAQLAGNRDLAEVALRKTLGPESAAQHVERVAGRITDLELIFNATMPTLEAELPLRIEPLRLQWEARGPGLLAELGRLTEPDLLVDRAEVVLVQPVLGGGGTAHHFYNSASFEAVVTDTVPELPEVLRLAWLVGQLNLDLPRHSEHLNRPQLESVAGAALLLPILSAAETVELARCDEPTLSVALEAWRLSPSADSGIVAALLDWWDVYQTSRPAWAVALRALAQIVGDSQSGSTKVETEDTD